MTRFHLHFYNFVQKATSFSLLSVIAPFIILTLSLPIHHVGQWTKAIQNYLINLHLSRDMT